MVWATWIRTHFLSHTGIPIDVKGTTVDSIALEAVVGFLGVTIVVKLDKSVSFWLASVAVNTDSDILNSPRP